MRRALIGLAWLGAAAAVYGFILPWAHLDVEGGRFAKTLEDIVDVVPDQAIGGKLSRVTVSIKQGTQTITGTLPRLANLPGYVSGFELPRVVNRSDTKVALALLEMLTGHGQLGLKSYLVYLLPGTAMLCALLVTIFRRYRLACLLIGLLCGAVAGAGFWKLLTVKTESLMAHITIGLGLWLSCWAYVGLAVAAMLLGLMTLTSRRA